MKMNEWMKGNKLADVFLGLGRFAECEDVPTDRALKLSRDFVAKHVRAPLETREYKHWAMDTESLGWLVVSPRSREDIRLSGALAWALAEAGFELKPLHALAVLVQVDLVNMKPPARVHFYDLTKSSGGFWTVNGAEVAAVLDGRPKYYKAPKPATYFRPDRP